MGNMCVFIPLLLGTRLHTFRFEVGAHGKRKSCQCSMLSIVHDFFCGKSDTFATLEASRSAGARVRVGFRCVEIKKLQNHGTLGLKVECLGALGSGTTLRFFASSERTAHKKRREKRDKDAKDTNNSPA